MRGSTPGPGGRNRDRAPVRIAAERAVYARLREPEVHVQGLLLESFKDQTLELSYWDFGGPN
jgi:hypothetical protein